MFKIVYALAAVLTLWSSASFAEQICPKQLLSHMQIKLEKGFVRQDLDGFQNIVHRLDANKDSHLSLEEYSKNSHFRNNPAGTLGFFGAADMNRDGKMSINEYAWQRIITDEARKIYFAMDRNQDRRVSREEFIRNSIVRDQKLAAQIFKCLDTNQNNELVLPEYLRRWGRLVRSNRTFKDLYQ